MSLSANLALLRRFSTVKPHVPMIRFRKGGPDSAGVSSPAAPVSSVSPPTAPAGPAVYEWWEMPAKFRREVVDQQECDVINMGGDGKLWR